jgi:hypothetical protein
MPNILEIICHIKLKTPKYLQNGWGGRKGEVKIASQTFFLF